MTNYELNKLASAIASEIVRKVKEDETLLDAVFPPRCMNIQEAADYARVPINTLYGKANEIPHMKAGRRLIFTDRGLITWMRKEGYK